MSSPEMSKLSQTVHFQNSRRYCDKWHQSFKLYNYKRLSSSFPKWNSKIQQIELTNICINPTQKKDASASCFIHLNLCIVNKCYNFFSVKKKMITSMEVLSVSGGRSRKWDIDRFQSLGSTGLGQVIQGEEVPETRHSGARSVRRGKCQWKGRSRSTSLICKMLQHLSYLPRWQDHYILTKNLWDFPKANHQITSWFTPTSFQVRVFLERTTKLWPTMLS